MIAFVLLYIGLFVVGAILIAIDSALDVGAFDAIAASASMIGTSAVVRGLPYVSA